MERTSRFFKRKDWVDKVKDSFGNQTEREFVEFDLGGVEVSMVLEEFPVGGKKLKALRFAGIYMSDYLDFEGRELVREENVAKLTQQATEVGVDFLWLSNIPTHSRLFEVLQKHNLKEGGEKTRFLESVPTLGVVCEDTFDDYLMNGVSKNTRRNIRRKNRKLDEKGARFEVVPADERNTLQFLESQDKRAKDKGLHSVMEDDEVERFIKSLSGAEDVYVANLIVGNKAISQLILLVHDKIISIFMQGFDPEWYDYSPSFCNISRLIEHAHDSGYAYVDFLRGDEEYKHRFANTQADMVKFVAVLNSQVDKEELFAFLNKYEE